MNIKTFFTKANTSIFIISFLTASYTFGESTSNPLNAQNCQMANCVCTGPATVANEITIDNVNMKETSCLQACNKAQYQNEKIGASRCTQ